MSLAAFNSRIAQILQTTTSNGAFAERHVLANGKVEMHRLAWATGMASSFALSSYAGRFGDLPGWAAQLHPSIRTQLCQLALGAAQPLPAERPDGQEELAAEPRQDFETDGSCEVAPPAHDHSRNSRFALIQEALQAAAVLEQQISPFHLTGRGYEKRVSVDRQLAQVLRAIELPHCRLSGYGPTCYYPERVFRRAAVQLRKQTSEDVLIYDHQGTRYYISTP